jgi:putative selenoprotein
MRKSGKYTRRFLRRFWRGLREWCGDAAYESYLRSRNGQRSICPLSPVEFYVEQLNRRYSRPNRCC